jgi:hypothetical protein
MAAVRGGDVDRKPLILLNGGAETDILIHRQRTVIAGGDSVTIVEVLNPLGRAIRHGFDLNELLHADPEAGARELDRLCDEVRAECDKAAADGADGICYRLIGAEPEFTTPMQYGGYYLERDRELLEETKDATFNLLWVDAGEEAYLDFVSDIAAHAFAWDIDKTDVSVVQMREMRRGALAADDPTADFVFAPTFEAVKPWIERETTQHA